MTKHPILTGVAFDYLLRFYIKKLNPAAITRPWIAERVLSLPSSPLINDGVYNSDTKKMIEYTETDLTKKVQLILDQAKEVYSDYISAGEMSDEVIATSLRLAQLDPIYRAGYIDKNIGTIFTEDINDLRQLISIVNPNLFKVQNIGLLNPGFGKASNLVGGADADLFIDGILIEIKTIKKLHFPRVFFDQLIGYYVLHEISGIGDLIPKTKISKIAVYYSRHAYLYIIDLKEIIKKGTFPHFTEWFKKRLKK